MINLLPKDHFRQLRASQQNTLMLRYTILSFVTLGVTIAIFGITFFMLKAAENHGNMTAQQNIERISSYEDVRKAATEYKANLAAAQSLLGKNTSYTTALLRIAEAIPPGVVLKNISLSPDIIKSAVTLEARSKSYGHGIELRDSLSKHKIGTDVKIIRLSSDNRTDAPGGEQAKENPYPFTAVIEITFAPDLFTKPAKPAEKQAEESKQTKQPTKPSADEKQKNTANQNTQERKPATADAVKPEESKEEVSR